MNMLINHPHITTAKAATAGVSLSPYVLLEVLEHLSPGRTHRPEDLYMEGPLAADKRHIRGRCLARIELVSRSVSALALDVLWAHVDDFGDLLSVFPSYDRKSAVLEKLTGFVVNELSTCYTLLLSPTIRILSLKVGLHIDLGTVRMVMQACQCTLSSLRHLTADEVTDVPDGAGRCRPPAIQAWSLAQLQSPRVVQEISLSADDLQALAALVRFEMPCPHAEEYARDAHAAARCIFPEAARARACWACWTCRGLHHDGLSSHSQNTCRDG
ncbi:hypothetical protein NUW54_g12908 [Trametes sanguinea]|uniref:Uncharacterized protein n=1 Tax=Trametes sanguinea TaxID=158606 RepID=A0ACC1MTT6_9APHY|nr:hypothetical protein NUW54_g12908 [Trametes sanguinea]